MLTLPWPRADISTSPGLFRLADVPTRTLARSSEVLIVEYAPAPLRAPPVIKLTLSLPVISFNARSANSPGSDSVPCPINCALLPTLTVVSKEIVVVLSALAPETNPPVVPLMLSVSKAGLRNALPASTEIFFARICEDAPIVEVTTLVTLLSISAPAPASRPPANVWTRPFNVVVLTAPRSNESVSVTIADVPIVANTLPVCVVIAVAEAPAATPPPPARLSDICE